MHLFFTNFSNNSCIFHKIFGRNAGRAVVSVKKKHFSVSDTVRFNIIMAFTAGKQYLISEVFKNTDAFLGDKAVRVGENIGDHTALIEKIFIFKAAGGGKCGGIIFNAFLLIFAAAFSVAEAVHIIGMRAYFKPPAFGKGTYFLCCKISIVGIGIVILSRSYAVAAHDIYRTAHIQLLKYGEGIGHIVQKAVVKGDNNRLVGERSTVCGIIINLGGGHRCIAAVLKILHIAAEHLREDKIIPCMRGTVGDTVIHKDGDICGDGGG